MKYILFLLIPIIAFAQVGNQKIRYQDLERTLERDVRRFSGDPTLTGLDSVGVYEHLKRLNSRTLDEYGAVGDGITDDYSAIVNALSSGYAIIAESGKTYYSSSPISITGNNIVINTSGPEKARFQFENGVTVGMAFHGTAGDTTSISSNANTGDKYMVVRNVSKVSVNQLVRCISDSAWYLGGTMKGELHKVKAISGDTLFFFSNVEDNYLATEHVVIHPYDPITVSIDNIIIGFPSMDNDIALQLNDCIHSKITNTEIDSAGATAIQNVSCFDLSIENCTIVNSTYDGSSGYGIVTVGCNFTDFSHNKIFNTKRGIDISSVSTGYPSRNFIVDANEISTVIVPQIVSVDGIGTHSGAEHGIFSNNIIRGSSRSAFTLRGTDISVVGNHVIGSGLNGAVYALNAYVWSSSGNNFNIVGNTYDAGLSMRTVNDVDTYDRMLQFFVQIDADNTYWDSENYLNISDNTINGFTTESGTLNGMLKSQNIDTVWNWTIKNNTCHYYTNPDSAEGTARFLNSSSTTTVFKFCNLSENTILLHNCSFGFDNVSRSSFDSSYVNYKLNGVNYIVHGTTNFGDNLYVYANRGSVQISGDGTKWDRPKLLFNNTDLTIVGGDTIGLVEFNSYRDPSVGALSTWGSIRAIANQNVSALGNLYGLMYISPSYQGIPYDVMKFDGYNKKVEVAKISVTPTLSGNAVGIDSIYVDSDSLKFRVGSIWYKAVKAN